MNRSSCRLALWICGGITLATITVPVSTNAQQAGQTIQDVDQRAAIRFAVFNVALNRNEAGSLNRELMTGVSPQAKQLAEVIQRARPHVILLNEIDFDAKGESIKLFCENYLAVEQNGQTAIHYEHRYTAPVNTGLDSGMDLNRDGRRGTAYDAFGYGAFAGQYGMAVLSQWPIDHDQVRTFQNFLWQDMPDAKLPVVPDTGQPYYPQDVIQRFRLSSKSHWDVPIQLEGRTIHLVCAHPTPPIFDGPEDRNGRRNHDEIRLIADYISGQADYLYDDQGQPGGLSAGDLFVIAGDMNADPNDGDSLHHAARLLLNQPRVNSELVPTSRGGVEASQQSGGANRQHRGDPAADTGDFSDEDIGNLRIDYVLPCRELRLLGGGVFWPGRGEPGHQLNGASDHHLVWIDVMVEKATK